MLTSKQFEHQLIVPDRKLDISPIQAIAFEGYPILVKRDDLLNPYFSGNKARKLACFLDNDFPKIRKLVSYGSVQSNFLYSIAALAKIKNWQLDFYVQRIPDCLKTNPIGNYCGALELGANIIEIVPEELSELNLEVYLNRIKSGLPDSSLFIPEGGRTPKAEYGVNKLAVEIEVYCRENGIVDLIIMLPSGTGTTAMFLSKYFNTRFANNKHSNGKKLERTRFRVLTCACAGDRDYLNKQFSQLSENKNDWPTVLDPQKKYHFGKLYPEHYDIWQDLKRQTDIEFDLLYDPIGWRCLLDYLKKQPFKNVLYIHQGGLVGNQSMLARYKRKRSATKP